MVNNSDNASHLGDSQKATIRETILEIRANTLKFPGSIKYFYLDELPIKDMSKAQLKALLKKTIIHYLLSVTVDVMKDMNTDELLEFIKFGTISDEFLFNSKIYTNDNVILLNNTLDDIYPAIYNYYVYGILPDDINNIK